MDRVNWLGKLGILTGIFLVVFLFGVNKNLVYEAKTDVLLLPKNELTVRAIGPIAGNFKQILISLNFFDRISDKNDSLKTGKELSDAARKEFWNSKIKVSQPEKSEIISIENFDKDEISAKNLNRDTINGLVASIGNYYNIKTDLEVRIIDGPIVERVLLKNLASIFWQSVLWAIIIYFFVMFFLKAFFWGKEKISFQMPENNLSEKISMKKTDLSIFSEPEEENYFATKDFSGKSKIEKTEDIKVVEVEAKNKPAEKDIFVPSFGKKAPMPFNLPVSEEEVPDIFRQKTEEVKEEKKVDNIRGEEIAEEKSDAPKEYVPHEATAEEVKERLNRLLGKK